MSVCVCLSVCVTYVRSNIISRPNIYDTPSYPIPFRYVSDVMGGLVSNMSAFHYELSLAESQHDLRSNLLPLGLVKKGAYRHRALLFKVRRERMQVAGVCGGSDV